MAVMSVLWWENYRKIGKITIKVPFVPVLVSKPFVTLRPEKMQSYTFMGNVAPLFSSYSDFYNCLCSLTTPCFFFLQAHIDLPPK